MSIARPADGYHFEDFTPGRRFHHATPRTLGEGDAALYIALTGARFPAHCSAPLARALGHRACPLDDFLVFNVAFGKTVPDISYNAIANLGYADVRFLAPLYAGDTLTCESEVIGTKPNSNGTSGVVYVRSKALDQDGAEILTWARWVMVAKRRKDSTSAGRRQDSTSAAPAATQGKASIPTLPDEVKSSELRVPAFLQPRGMTSAITGSDRLWEDFSPGEVVDHPGGMTLEESDHMLATRLYQNTARIHFDALRARESQFGKRLIYGGHVISICRALSYEGLENAFAVAAIHAGSHSNPTFAGDTVYCRHVVVGRSELAGRGDVGALRLRMLGVKNMALAGFASPAPGEKSAALVLDLDYSVLIPRRQNP